MTLPSPQVATSICTRFRHTLNRKRPDEWLHDILQLPECARVAAASVIWWDYFSQRLPKDRWPELDQYLAMPVRTGTNAELIEALRRCGYSAQAACYRVTRKHQKPISRQIYKRGVKEIFQPGEMAQAVEAGAGSRVFEMAV